MRDDLAVGIQIELDVPNERVRGMAVGNGLTEVLAKGQKPRLRGLQVEEVPRPTRDPNRVVLSQVLLDLRKDGVISTGSVRVVGIPKLLEDALVQARKWQHLLRLQAGWWLGDGNLVHEQSRRLPDRTAIKADGRANLLNLKSERPKHDRHARVAY